MDDLIRTFMHLIAAYCFPIHSFLRYLLSALPFPLFPGFTFTAFIIITLILQLRQRFCPTAAEKEVIDYLALDGDLPDFRSSQRGNVTRRERETDMSEKSVLIGY